MGRVPIGLAAVVCCLLPNLLGCGPLVSGGLVGSGDPLALPQPDLVSEDFPRYAEEVPSPESDPPKSDPPSGVVGDTSTREAAPGGTPDWCPPRPGLIFGWLDQIACFGGQLFSGRGGPPEPYVEEGEHIHARFFPVPTRPVFWPRRALPPPIPGGPFPERPWVPSGPAPPSSIRSGKPAAPINIHVPEPPPGQIPVAPVPSHDREARAPRRLWVASGAKSWLFPVHPDGQVPRSVASQAQREANGGRVFR